jgi:hypothetical protein
MWPGSTPPGPCCGRWPRFLHGQDFPALGNPRVLAPLLGAGNLLPARPRERLYAASGGLTAVPVARLRRPFAEDVAAWMTSLYPRRRYPLALIGSSNGAAVHLAAALGVPWLPQTFMVPVRNPGNDPDDPRRDLEWGREPARALLDANPEVQVHHMHDPVQDRLMLEQMTYFRLKRLRLGPAYERFLRDTVELGGTLLLLDCRQTWPVTQVGDRHLYQFGAVGAPPRRSSSGAATGSRPISPATAPACAAGTRQHPTARHPKPSGASRKPWPPTSSGSPLSRAAGSGGWSSTPRPT